MLHTKIQASEPSSFRKRRLLICSTYFYASNTGPLRRSHFELWDVHLKKTWLSTTRQCYILNSSTSAKLLRRNRFQNFPMYFCGSNTRPPPQGQFGSQGHHLNNLVEVYYKMLRTKYQSCLVVSEKMLFEENCRRHTTYDARRTLADGTSSP